LTTRRLGAAEPARSLLRDHGSQSDHERLAHLRDLDIRVALTVKLSSEHHEVEDFALVEEMALCQGSARADIVAFNGRLHGYEIKSPRDTLRRLPGQVDVYSRVLDRATVVTAASRIHEVESLVPSWWGIMTAHPCATGVTVRTTRSPRDNPSRDALAVAQLLWRGECLSLLHELGCGSGLSSKPRPELWATLVDALPLDELCKLVRVTIQSRSGWRESRLSP
jgi:hypothetical protein